MKKVGSLFIFVWILFGCDSGDLPANSIAGTWNLRTFQCCLFQTEQFNQGDIIWKFNSNEILEVNINIVLEDESQIPIQENGSFSYDFNQTSVVIDNTEYDFTLENDQLILSDDPEVDGPIIIFDKN